MAGLIESFVKGMLQYSLKGSLISLSHEIIAFSLAISLVLGLLCDLYPAIKSSRLTSMETIRSSLE